MLDKFQNYFKRLTSKIALRIGFVLAAVVVVVVGCAVIDRPQVVYGDSIHHVNAAYGNVSENFDTAELAQNTEKSPDGEIAGDAVKQDASSADMPRLTLLNNSEYSLKPVTVTTTYETVTETVKFGYKTVYSKDLYKGETQTTKGKNGEKQVVYCVVSVNGIVMSREVESEEITKEAVPQIETIGTKLHSSAAVMTSEDVKCISTLKPDKPVELDKNGIPVNYTKVITGKASAYCGKCDNNMTAIGLPAQPGLVAVNFSQIPKYTKMYIVCDDGTVYGYSMAADTGGFAHSGSNRVVDVRLPTGSSCICGSSWGVKNVTIYILE